MSRLYNYSNGQLSNGQGRQQSSYGQGQARCLDYEVCP
jgi:hypothetical protein